MSNLLPEKWSEALERVHDKVGNFLNRLAPWKKQEHLPERIPAVLNRGPLMRPSPFRRDDSGTCSSISYPTSLLSSSRSLY